MGLTPTGPPADVPARGVARRSRAQALADTVKCCLDATFDPAPRRFLPVLWPAGAVTWRAARNTPGKLAPAGRYDGGEFPRRRSRGSIEGIPSIRASADDPRRFHREAATNTSNRSRPWSRHRFMPRPRKSTEIRPSRPEPDPAGLSELLPGRECGTVLRVREGMGRAEGTAPHDAGEGASGLRLEAVEYGVDLRSHNP